MNQQDFDIELEKSYLRSKRLLSKKAGEYALGKDRLEQFHRIAAATTTNPAEALVNLSMKHVTSIADMSKCPKAYNLRKWREKITDLRNYTFLLDALLIDLEVK